MSALVIGIGNPDRGDDAAGVRVVERLRSLAPPGVRLETVGGDLLTLLDLWAGAESVVLVDAMVSGAEAGSVRRLDASDRGLREQLGTFVSSHAFGLGDAIELARNLGRLPERLVVYGVEADQIGPGAPLSDAVARAIPVVAEEILEECRCTRLR